MMHIFFLRRQYTIHCVTRRNGYGVENHLGFEFTHNLILTTNKGLLKGDYLIDDYVAGRGQENFEGELIHFGSDKYPDWCSIMKCFQQSGC